MAFELITAMLKVVRAFSGFRGKSYLDSSKEVEVS